LNSHECSWVDGSVSILAPGGATVPLLDIEAWKWGIKNDRAESRGPLDELERQAAAPLDIGSVATRHLTHWGEAVDRAHHVEAHTDHVGVGADREELRVRHAAARDRAEHARLAQHRVVAVLAEVSRRTAQHHARVAVAPGQQEDVVLGSAGELFDLGHRALAGQAGLRLNPVLESRPIEQAVEVGEGFAHRELLGRGVHAIIGTWLPTSSSSIPCLPTTSVCSKA